MEKFRFPVLANLVFDDSAKLWVLFPIQLFLQGAAVVTSEKFLEFGLLGQISTVDIVKGQRLIDVAEREIAGHAKPEFVVFADFIVDIEGAGFFEGFGADQDGGHDDQANLNGGLAEGIAIETACETFFFDFEGFAEAFSSCTPVDGGFDDLIVADACRVGEGSGGGGVFLKDVECLGEEVGLPLIVGIEEREKLAGCHFEAQISGGACAAVLFFDVLDTALPVGFDDFGSVVGRAVIDDDDLVGRQCLGEHRIEGTVEEVGAVVGGDDDADFTGIHRRLLVQSRPDQKVPPVAG